MDILPHEKYRITVSNSAQNAREKNTFSMLSGLNWEDCIVMCPDTSKLSILRSLGKYNLMVASIRNLYNH